MRDFAPVTLIGWTPIIIVANPDLKIASATELIALCKGKQGNLSYSFLRPCSAISSPAPPARPSQPQLAMALPRWRVLAMAHGVRTAGVWMPDPSRP